MRSFREPTWLPRHLKDQPWCCILWHCGSFFIWRFFSYVLTMYRGHFMSFHVISCHFMSFHAISWL